MALLNSRVDSLSPGLSPLSNRRSPAEPAAKFFLTLLPLEMKRYNMLQHCTLLYTLPLRNFPTHFPTLPSRLPGFANHFVPQMLLLLLLLLPVSSVNIDLKSIHLPLRQCLIFYGPSAQLEVFISRQNFSANFPLPPLAYKTFPKFRIT